MPTSITLFKPSRTVNWYVQFIDTDGTRKEKNNGCSTQAGKPSRFLQSFKRFLNQSISRFCFQRGRAIY